MNKVKKVIQEVYQLQKPSIPRTTTSMAGERSQPLNNSFAPPQQNKNNNLLKLSIHQQATSHTDNIQFQIDEHYRKIMNDLDKASEEND